MYSFIRAIQLYATFSGRATRRDYWMFMLIYLLIYIVLVLISAEFHSIFLLSLFSLLMIIPSISVTTRRLHDTGRSGWWQLIYFVPLIGIIVMLVFTVQTSDNDNPFGNKPFI